MSGTIIVPAKGLSRAKSRLGDALPGGARATLAGRLLSHVLSTVRAAAPTLTRLVVTDGDDTAALARALGAEVVRDPGGSLARAVEAGVARAPVELPVLVMMADLPELTVEDVRALLAALDGFDLALAPDPERLGTSALAARAGLVFPIEFGSGESFVRYAAWARARALCVTVLERAGLSRDLDGPDALVRLAASTR